MIFKQYKIFMLLLPALTLLACGEGKVTINESSYQPKIVIQGTLIPGQLARVKLRRNFPLNAVIDTGDILLRNAQARIADAEGNEFELQFNSASGYYESPQLLVENGRTYILQVDATIDGKDLSANSTTKVPLPGFKILEHKSRLGSTGYRQEDDLGNLENLNIVFERSPDTDYYAASINALNADRSTFIYENVFVDLDSEDVDVEDFKNTFTWIQDAPLEPGESKIDIFSFLTWFYSPYQVIVYAADKNFKDFLSTNEQIQEIDGNFHEPAFHINGNGIGLFGSAVVDTAYFEIVR